MFRKFSLFGGKSRKNRPKKKRLSPAAHDRNSNGDVETTVPPSYQYAMNEYALTSPSMTTRRSANSPNVDDDGKIRPSYSMTEVEEEEHEFQQQQQQQTSIDQSKQPQQQQQQQQQSSQLDPPTQHDDVQRQKQSATPRPPPPPPGQPSTRDGILRSSSRRSQRQQQLPEQLTQYSPYNRRRYLSPKAEYFSYDEDDNTTTTMGGNGDDGSIGGPSMLKHPSYINQNNNNGNVEPMMPDSTYEEWYGDAYVGGPIRYIYPSGYQSMRPRGGPWKLSIVVCLLFTWLSIFVIGHCSDNYTQKQASQNNNNNNNNDNNYEYSYIDDDNLVIDAKWCGSRLLYWLWVISMLITGLATAYCGVIGYIKIRDFAVANTRSQPPGIMTVGDYSLSPDGNVHVNSSHRQGTQGNSDYYVPIGDANNNGIISRQQHISALNNNSNTARLQQTHPSQYNKTIYQADGTPQFWGNQIYRPNQAAVAITSR